MSFPKDEREQPAIMCPDMLCPFCLESDVRRYAIGDTPLMLGFNCRGCSQIWRMTRKTANIWAAVKTLAPLPPSAKAPNEDATAAACACSFCTDDDGGELNGGELNGASVGVDEIKVGDVVRLRSGGLALTVTTRSTVETKTGEVRTRLGLTTFTPDDNGIIRLQGIDPACVQVVGKVPEVRPLVPWPDFNI